MSFTDSGILNLALDPISLDAPSRATDNGNVIDRVSNKKSADPEKVVIDDMLRRELVESVVETLDEREQIIIKMRYGLLDGRIRTLEEVGKEFDLTRERVRQIEHKALTKMRGSKNAKILEAYRDDMRNPIRKSRNEVQAKKTA